MYPNIDIEKTGIKLKTMLNVAGYDVKYIQKYLGLACPQSIYKWFKGKALPSVENLCALSMLLHIHIEELLVFQNPNPVYFNEKNIPNNCTKRLFHYYKCLNKAV